jgi:hypothetical protein
MLYGGLQYCIIPLPTIALLERGTEGRGTVRTRDEEGHCSFVLRKIDFLVIEYEKRCETGVVYFGITTSSYIREPMELMVEGATLRIYSYQKQEHNTGCLEVLFYCLV